MTIRLSPSTLAALEGEYPGAVVDTETATDMVEIIVSTWLKKVRDSRRLIDECQPVSAEEMSHV